MVTGTDSAEPAHPFLILEEHHHEMDGSGQLTQPVTRFLKVKLLYHGYQIALAGFHRNGVPVTTA